MKELKIALVLAVFLATTAGAQEIVGPISGNLSHLDDREIDARIAFIEERLDAGQRNARIWQYGFTGLYSLGIVTGTVRAATQDGDDQVAGIVGAVKGLFGTTRMLLAPHPGRLGADPVRAISGDSREARLERLERAEAQLYDVVMRTESRFSWKRHAANIGVNLAGGLIVGFVGDTTDAIVDSTVGFVVGEIMTFTMPWRSTRDVREYKERFGLASEPAVTWHIEPITRQGIRGAAIQLRF
jgi:hypothetical protein